MESTEKQKIEFNGSLHIKAIHPVNITAFNWNWSAMLRYLSTKQVNLMRPGVEIQFNYLDPRPPSPPPAPFNSEKKLSSFLSRVIP